jgi:uncharacterized Zn-finger protein
MNSVAGQKGGVGTTDRARNAEAEGLATGVLCTHIMSTTEIDSPGVDGREWRVLPCCTQRGSDMPDSLLDQERATRLRSPHEAEAPVVVAVPISSSRSGTTTRAGRYPKFLNDRGVPEIRIAARQFECIGMSPPQDHPHIYIDMADRAAILCPYCATRFCFDERLGLFEADPPDSLFVAEDLLATIPTATP